MIDCVPNDRILLERSMNVNNARCLRLVRTAIARMEADWDSGVRLVERHLDVMRRGETCSEHYLDAIVAALRRGPESFRHLMLAEDDQGQVLRSIFPFGGLVSNADMLQVVREVPREAGAA